MLALAVVPRLSPAATSVAARAALHAGAGGHSPADYRQEAQSLSAAIGRRLGWPLGLQPQLSGGQDAFVARVVILAQPLSALDPVSPPGGALTTVRYFSATHHSVRGPFPAFYSPTTATSPSRPRDQA